MSRASRNVAFLAAILALLSLAMSWWGTTAVGPGYSFAAADTGILSPTEGLVHREWVWTSLALVLVGVGLLGIRIAARSWYHEPRSWRRDLVVAALLFVASAMVVGRWPIEVPFWGSTIVDSDTGESLRGAPEAGWYLILVAAVLTGVAARLRVDDAEPGRTDDPSNGSRPKA